MMYCKTSFKSTIQVCYQRECLVAMEGRSEVVCRIAGGKENEGRVWGISILKRQHESDSYRSLHRVLLCFCDTVHSCNCALLCVNCTLHCREVQRGGAAFTALQWLSSYFLPFRALKEVLWSCSILHYKLVPNSNTSSAQSHESRQLPTAHCTTAWTCWGASAVLTEGFFTMAGMCNSHCHTKHQICLLVETYICSTYVLRISENVSCYTLKLLFRRSIL